MPTALENARELASWGFNVLPARGKSPAIKWQEYERKRTDQELSRWFKPGSQFNYWVLCGGISGWICLDCDSEAGEAFWRHNLGDEILDATTCVQTAKGKHYWFRIPDGATVPTWSQNEAQREAGVLFDIRAEGAGAIVPPSVHESGHVYAWVRDPSHAQEAPEALFGPRTTGEDGEAPQTRSLLTQLLSTPPKGEGGRNNWLARVAGHYAKHWAPNIRDAYDFHVDEAAAKLTPPLPDDEIDKLKESIWKKECAKGRDELVGVEPSEANGYLFSGGNILLTECVTGKGRDAQSSLEVWGDFDIRARGVVEDDDARRVYDVEIARRRQGDIRYGMLPASVLADPRQLNVWLAEFGVSILPPPGMVAKGSANQRLARFLESQDPPHFQAVASLGWHGNGFICHEGVITADGIQPHTTHKPSRDLANWAKYHYGFGIPEDQAIELLREVLTFHHDEVCSVFGSYWAVCFLKAQLQDAGQLSQFPFMALQAPSESGKSTGFFSMMVALNGNQRLQTAPTAAALRDAISSHRSGLVWIDDLSATEHLMDLLRQATSEGTTIKKGEDRHTQEAVKLVAPIVLSGEALDLSGQKALMDRAIMLDVPSPTERRSRHQDRLQWDDIVDLRNKYPDLTEAAGTLTQIALRHANLTGELKGLRTHSGRFGDKIAVVRLGARLLTEMTGDAHHIDVVDAWADNQHNAGNENTLTMEIIPNALAQNGFPTKPSPADGRWPSTPAFVDEGVVWFSPRSLALWWFEMKHGRVRLRTESEEALVQQAKALGLGGDKGRTWGQTEIQQRRRFNLGGDRNNKQWYWSADPELSALLQARARGEDGVPEGVPMGSPQGRQGVFEGLKRLSRYEEELLGGAHFEPELHQPEDY